MIEKARQQIYFGLFFVLGLIFIFHPDGSDLLNIKSTEILVRQPIVNLKSVDGKNVDLVAFSVGDRVAYKKLKVSFDVKVDKNTNSPIPLMVDLFGTSFDPPEYNFLLNSSEIGSQPVARSITYQLGENLPRDLKIRAYTLSEQPVVITNFTIEFINSRNPVYLLANILKIFLIIFLINELLYLKRNKMMLFGEDNLIVGYRVLTALTLLFCISNNHYRFYHDSLGYWTYGKLFVRNGVFSILNYDNALRGYLFPLVNFLQIGLSKILHIDEHFVFRFFSSFVFTFFGFYLFPSFIKRLFEVKILFWQRFIFCIILLIFWRGYALYPLTDIFALMSVVGSILLLFKDGEEETKYRNYLYSGALVAAAVNMRPSYILVLGFVFILCLRSIFLDWKVIKKTMLASKLMLWFLGMFFVWYPQFEINRVNFEVRSPLVPMEKFFNGKNLMLSKLYNGLTIQKYETYIGSSHNASIILNIDVVGSEIINSENFKEFSSYGHFFDILMKYPGTFMLMYLRHLFNGLDVMFITPYVDNFESPLKYGLQVLNLSIWFLFFMTVWLYISKWGFSVIKNKFWSFVGAGVLVVPTMISIPTEPEVRFFMPAYFLAYITTILLFESCKTIVTKKKILSVSIVFFIFLTATSWYSWHLGQKIRFE